MKKLGSNDNERSGWGVENGTRIPTHIVGVGANGWRVLAGLSGERFETGLLHAAAAPLVLSPAAQQRIRIELPATESPALLAGLLEGLLSTSKGTSSAGWEKCK